MSKRLYVQSSDGIGNLQASKRLSIHRLPPVLSFQFKVSSTSHPSQFTPSSSRLHTTPNQLKTYFISDSNTQLQTNPPPARSRNASASHQHSTWPSSPPSPNGTPMDRRTGRRKWCLRVRRRCMSTTCSLWCAMRGRLIMGIIRVLRDIRMRRVPFLIRRRVLSTH